MRHFPKYMRTQKNYTKTQSMWNDIIKHGLTLEQNLYQGQILQSDLHPIFHEKFARENMSMHENYQQR